MTTCGVSIYRNVYKNYVNSDYTYYPSSSASVTWDNSRIVVQPTDTNETSRLSHLTQVINNYNTDNSFTDNSTNVNYYIGTLDENGTLTDYYSPSLYDEETLVFTEPVTGAQYLTTGWTYDYATRSYDIDLDAGTFLINDTDITRILCTYGDDAVTIGYYDSNGATVQTDEYAYVMVASSACALNGHSYTVETTKEASCTGTGERVYTCSVCGDQRVEEIPMLEHSSTYSVFKEATCTDSGVALYTCSTCGTQYTETIEALGHDWLSTDGVDTTYALPEGTSCPACDSTDFACVLDEASSTYSCTCNSCGTAWTVSAEVTAGYINYTCSRCGATKTEYDGDEGNGLFTSIGSFLADGISWCTEKLVQLVDSLTGITDSFNAYLETISAQSSSYPTFLGHTIALLPEDLMAVFWFGIIALIALAVWKKWLD